MVEQLSEMIHEILETSKLNLTTEPPKQIDASELLAELCEPYQLIAAAHQITFSLDLPEQFPAVLPVGLFNKAVSNVLANAVAYTGKMFPSIWRGEALWSKTSASLSLTMKSAACLNRFTVRTSPGAGKAGATAWASISWTRF